MNAIAQGEYFNKRSKDFLSDLKGIVQELQQYNTEIGELEKDLSQLKIDIIAIGKVDISDFTKKT